MKDFPDPLNPYNLLQYGQTVLHLHKYVLLYGWIKAHMNMKRTIKNRTTAEATKPEMGRCL
jgi:hypothetical protein